MPLYIYIYNHISTSNVIPTKVLSRQRFGLRMSAWRAGYTDVCWMGSPFLALSMSMNRLGETRWLCWIQWISSDIVVGQHLHFDQLRIFVGEIHRIFGGKLGLKSFFTSLVASHSLSSACLSFLRIKCWRLPMETRWQKRQLLPWCHGQGGLLQWGMVIFFEDSHYGWLDMGTGWSHEAPIKVGKANQMIINPHFCSAWTFFISWWTWRDIYIYN